MRIRADRNTLIVLAVLGIGGYLLYRKAGSVVKDVGAAVLPTNPDNVFAETSSSIADILDNGVQDGSNSLGTYIYEVFNPNQGSVLE